MERWERMKEIFQILQIGNQFSIRELTEIINNNDESVSLGLVDALCRHYYKRGYLKRQKNPLNNYIYEYELTDKGFDQLESFLDNNEYLNYIEEYYQENLN